MYQQGPQQDGPKEKPEVERELSQEVQQHQVQQQRQQQEQPMPPPPPRTSLLPSLRSSPQRQDELQTASALKEEALNDGDPSREEQTLVGTAKKMELTDPIVSPKKYETEEMGDSDPELVLMKEERREKQEALVPLAQATRTPPLPPLSTAERAWWLDRLSSETPPRSPPSPQKQAKIAGDQQETAGKKVMVGLEKEAELKPEDDEVMEKPAQG